MASINYAAREISVKIVYYGPGLSGKTTNLQVIHKKVPPDYKSDMVSLATETDRTLFFDFLPLDLGKIKGFATKFQLYTVPGQVYYNATRKLVLRGVDGVVFVADSGADKIQENLESFQNLEDNLAEYGYQRESIPIILQYNKRDLPNAMSIEDLQAHVNKYNLPFGEAIAYKGVGVFDTLKQIGKIVIDHLNRKYSKPSRGGASQTQASAPKPQAPPRPQAPSAPRPQQSGSMPRPQGQQFTPPPQPQQYRPPQGQQFTPPQQPQQYRPPQGQQFTPPPQPQQYRPPQGQQLTPPPQPSQPYQAPQGMPQQAPWEQTPPAQQNSDSFQQQPYDFSPPQESQGQRGDNQSEESLPLSNYDDIFTSPEQPAAASQSSYDAEPISFEPASPYEANTDSDEIEIESFPRAGYDQSQQQPDEGELPDYNSMEYQQNQSFEQPAASDFGTGEVPQNRTDLDLEIEKYQKEIEEKQKKMRTSPGQYPDDSQEMQSFSSPADQNPYQSQSLQDYEQAEEEEEDFDVFMGPQQNGGNVDSEEGDDAMYFTSIDRDRHKRPVKRPVNPKTKGQNQKGFLKKFFNKDNM